MSKVNLSKEWIKENSEKIKKAYNIAAINKYDIHSTEIVLKLMEEVDPENATNENAEIFSKVLQLFDNMAKRKLIRKVRSN